METQFIYLKEDTKFWIVSSIVGLAIIILIFLSSIEPDKRVGSGIVDTTGIKYYSKILGVNSSGNYWSKDIFRINLPGWDTWHRGEPIYAANVE